jgi:hypothetical protein
MIYFILALFIFVIASAAYLIYDFIIYTYETSASSDSSDSSVSGVSGANINLLNEDTKDITENYENNDHIYFMTYKDTANFFANDADMYVRNMTDLDLHARKVKTHMEYINNIEDTAISFTEEEKDLLKRCAENADIFLRKESFKELKYMKYMKYAAYINGNNIADIKWVFANTYTNRFNDILKENEEGLPHTRENVIFLSKNVLKYDEITLTNTLIHEKIHIYQRYNSKIFDKIISEMGLKELDKKSYKYAKYIRSNPDTNNKIYYAAAAADTAEIDEDSIMVCLYRNNKPNGINDVIHTNYAKEHPYEKIAYEIAENFYKNNNDKYINI